MGNGGLKVYFAALPTTLYHQLEQLTGNGGDSTLKKSTISNQFPSNRVVPMPQFSEYFCRNQGALTTEQQQTLQQSRVMVVGCGGLGGYVIEQLVRVGVGHLDIFDPDGFSPSNCNRQLNALSLSPGQTMGQNKAEVAAARSAAIHPFNTVTSYPIDFRDSSDAAWCQVEVIVDCLDNVLARRDLAALCTSRGIPLVHGAVNGWYGQVGVQLPGGELIAHLYPERTKQPQAAPSVLSFTVAVVASLQVSEIVKLLLGLSSSLHNTWMPIDLKNNDFLVTE